LRPIVIEVEGRVAAPVDLVFDVFMPIDLTTIMLGYGPLPAVAGIEDQTGPWDSVGESRIIRLADGHGMLETLDRVDRPHGFGYTVSNLTNALRHLVDRFHGAWTFEAVGSADGPVETRAVWRYDFVPRSWLTRPVSWLILVAFWRPTMRNALVQATLQAELAVEHSP